MVRFPVEKVSTRRNDDAVSTSFFFLVPESLQELEDNDLDALMADLVADLNATEQKIAAEIEELDVPPPPLPKSDGANSAPSASSSTTSPTSPDSGSTVCSVSGPASSATSPLPAPPPQSAKPTMVSEFCTIGRLMWSNSGRTVSALILQRQFYAKRTSKHRPPPGVHSGSSF